MKLFRHQRHTGAGLCRRHKRCMVTYVPLLFPDWTLQLSCSWSSRITSGRNLSCSWSSRITSGRNLSWSWFSRITSGRNLSWSWSSRITSGRNLSWSWFSRITSGRKYTCNLALKISQPSMSPIGSLSFQRQGEGM